MGWRISARPSAKRFPNQEAGRPGWDALLVLNWRRGSELNRRMGLLQSPALPLGYRALILDTFKLPPRVGRFKGFVQGLPFGHILG